MREPFGARPPGRAEQQRRWIAFGFSRMAKPVGQHGADTVPEHGVRAFVDPSGQHRAVQVIQGVFPSRRARFGPSARPWQG